MISIKNWHKDPLVKEKEVPDTQKSIHRSQSHKIWSRDITEAGFSMTICVSRCYAMSLLCHKQGRRATAVTEMRLTMVFCTEAPVFPWAFQVPQEQVVKGWLQHVLYDSHMITQRPLSCPHRSWFPVPVLGWGLPVGCAGLHSPDSHCRGNGVGSCELCVGSPEVSGWAALNPKWLRIPSSQEGAPQLKRLPFIWDCDFSFSFPVLPADFLVLEFTLVNARSSSLLPHEPPATSHTIPWPGGHWNTSQAQFPSLAACLKQCAMLLATD